MSDAVGTRLREARRAAGPDHHAEGCAYGDRTTITRSRTRWAAPVDSPRAIGAVASCALLDGVDLSPGVRLLGVSVSGLAHTGVEAHQLSFARGGAAPGAGRGASTRGPFRGPRR